MVDFNVQKPILLLLVANFQKHLEILKFYLLWVKSYPMDDQKICFFLKQQRKFICSTKATSHKTLPTCHNALKIFQEVIL